MSGYTLIGFTGSPSNVGFDNIINGRMFARIPIYLPNQEVQGSVYSRLPTAESMFIILPELYKVKWAHGKLNIMDVLCNGGYIKLCDENEESLIPGARNRGTTPAEFRVWVNEIIDLQTNRTRQDILNEIGQKYPGLFISEFIVSKKMVPSPLAQPEKQIKASNFDPAVFRNKEIVAPDISPPPELVQSKTKKSSKQSKPIRNPSETKKHRNQRASQYPKWWVNAPNSN